MRDETRLAIGEAIGVAVLALVFYGLWLGAERCAASEAAAATPTEERLEREGEPPWQREMSPATT